MKSEVLDGIIEHLRIEHDLIAEPTGWFYTVEIGKDHDLTIEIRSHVLKLEEYVYEEGPHPVWEMSYELSDPVALDMAIKMILKLADPSIEVGAEL